MPSIKPQSLFLVALAWPRIVLSEEIAVKTYAYKTLDPAGAQLQADVYRPPGEAAKPVVIFIHGGALMMGGRSLSAKPGSLLDTLLKAGYVVVSIDYRLAPQVKLPVIIEDVQDACRWVRVKGPELFRINPAEVFVMGQSAGGYLTLVTGFQVEPITIQDGGHGFGRADTAVAARTYQQVVEFLNKHRE